MSNYAYLIIAHKDWSLLNKLLECIDDKRNSIFLHIDKKSIFDPSIIYNPKKSYIEFIRRKKISWGGYSLIEIEINLLETAINYKKFDYYHLISGTDLPIKNQDYIHSFFGDNEGRNFIRFDPKTEENNYINERLKYFHFLQDKIGRNSKKWNNIYEYFERMSIFFQKKININRISNCNYKLYKGTQWFSITHDMAKYIISKKEDIKRIFNYCLCADEIFLQTIAMESPFNETIVDDSLREIDWKRGSPYTYRIDDYDMLMNSSKIFARKFSSEIDDKIIDMVYERIKSR